MRLRQLLPVLLLALSSCNTIAPSPILFHRAVEANNESVSLYKSCSEGANYVPTKEGCDPVKLETKIEEVLPLSKECISADVKQPQCYMIYSANVRVYCRITTCASQEYGESEAIARQFFEVQKASHGSALQEARVAWVQAATAYASWQWREDKFALNAERKIDLLLCYAEGSQALQESLPGPEKIRLIQSLQVLKAITDAI